MPPLCQVAEAGGAGRGQLRYSVGLHAIIFTVLADSNTIFLKSQ